MSTTDDDLDPHQQIQEQQDQEPMLYDVTDGCRTKDTAKTYRIAFNHFLEVTVKNDDRRALLDTKQSAVESKIIDHVRYLKDVEKLKYRSILIHLQAIYHFFEINDYTNLNRKKIKRFLPEDESDHYATDRPYSIQEIGQILSKCDPRSRVAVLLMASSGLRIGGLRELQLGDLKKIDEFNLYLIWVYNRSGKNRYYTFCSPECAKAIDEYLLYRQKCGEQLKDKNPRIRDNFGVDNPFTAQAPKFISKRGIFLLFEETLNRAKINPIIPSQKKRAVACSHGFRKFYINQCNKAHLDYTTWKYLAGHRLTRTDASYIRTTEEDRLAEYVKAIDLLTIDPTKRIEQENYDLKHIQAQEIAQLKKTLDKHQEYYKNSWTLINEMKEQTEKYRKTAENALKLMKNENNKTKPT